MAPPTLPDGSASKVDSKAGHVLAVAILCLVILIRWWQFVMSPTTLIDENIYLEAFQQAVDDQDPYLIGGFYYPRTFALLGGWLLGNLGELAVKVLLRAASVGGLSLVVWIAACTWSAPWLWRVVAGAAYLSIAPAVNYGIAVGNVTFVITALILSGLVVWSRHPVMAGLILGGSTGIKPLAPLAILALVAHRPRPLTRANWVAGGLAGSLAAGLLATNAGYLAITPDSIGRLPFIRSISLNRILVLLGVEVSPVLIAAVLGAILVLVARLHPMSRRDILCFGGLAAVLAVPIIWSHTLLLTLPLQVVALTTSVARRRRPSATDHVWLRYEWIFVLLGVAALQLTEGLGAIDDQALAFQLVVLTVAYLAAPALMAYVLAVGDETAGAV